MHSIEFVCPDAEAQEVNCLWVVSIKGTNLQTCPSDEPTVNTSSARGEIKNFSINSANMFNKKRTLRKVKKHDPGSKRYNLHKQAKATLGVGNARMAVRKPDDETLEDWLAMNSVFRS